MPKKNSGLGEAEREYRLALKLRPDYIEALQILDVTWGREGELDEAAIGLRPDDARAYYDLSLALKAKGDAVGAQEARRRALELQSRGGASQPPAIP